MSKWKNTSNHWSKTDKREEVLGKVVKNFTHNYWKGNKRSQETKDKISLTKTGNSPSWNKGGKAPWCKGEKNFNWKGGVLSEHQKIRNSLEYKNWTKDVYKRDNWTCCICKIKGSRKNRIIAHHTLSFSEYPKYRFELLNGITLCRSCHKKVHNNIGKNTRFKKCNYI